ncbi:acyl transferase [Spirosoma sp. BT702]|uniref:Acyl transferase n=1 Tax=Spirosoma profusum TaxID=2771354 RepID=A0A927AQJ0_9BACT|nr:acyl transferase [Spirosoma profusum]MBD2700556.1 acyl transferase [Spirosoma profusum]
MSFPLIRSTEAEPIRQALRRKILAISSQSPDVAQFDELALSVFHYQSTYNPLYRDYLKYLNVRPEQVTEVRQIPFLPIGFFKRHTVQTGISNQFTTLPPDTLMFASSGTTGDQTSRHYVPDSALYEAISVQIFEQLYGPLQNVNVLALLPSYLERNNSSLVYMVQRFIDRSKRVSVGMNVTPEPTSGFFLNNYDELTSQLRSLSQRNVQKKILLIGVTFALLDWAESSPDLSFLGNLSSLIIMETGGMKGRRRELLREEVHTLLKDRLGVQAIHSEYGMTELLSQAYSTGEGVFRPSPTLRVLLRDINDPFHLYPNDFSRSGGVNVVDLANLDSCSFIETQDLGQYVGNEGNFRVIGRFDNSDVRGCNLMIQL